MHVETFVVTVEFIARAGKIDESDVKLRIEDMLESMQTTKDDPIIGMMDIVIKKTRGAMGKPDPSLRPTNFPQ